MLVRDLSRERRNDIKARLARSADAPSAIRAIARELRFPIADLARGSGIPYGRAERLLNGRAPARPEEIAALVRALGVAE
jgi:hypothetical protein